VCAFVDPLSVPQFAAPQLKDQSTPARAESLATIAVNDAECAAPLVATYTFDCRTLTVTGTGGGGTVICMAALADLVVSTNEVAVIVTAPPAGTAVGAAYVVKKIVSPDVFTTGGLMNDPHVLAEPQVAVQITPALVGSFVTWAFRPSVVLITKDDGIAVLVSNVTPIGAATIVRLTLLLCDRLLVTVAVTVIEVLIGTWDGAV
jgi:hypothetical protein